MPRLHLEVWDYICKISLANTIKSILFKKTVSNSFAIGLIVKNQYDSKKNIF